MARRVERSEGEHNYKLTPPKTAKPDRTTLAAVESMGIPDRGVSSKDFKWTQAKGKADQKTTTLARESLPHLPPMFVGR